MRDTLTQQQRSWNMAQIKSRNTKPEVQLRSLLHRAGYRFTVNATTNRKLPGRPDIVLPKYKSVIFVHGCFWHRHAGCPQTTTPKTNTAFWTDKFARNVARDTLSQRQLKHLGWNVIVVWECEIKRLKELKGLKQFKEFPPPRFRQHIPKVAQPSKTLLAAEEQAEYRTEQVRH